MRDRLTVEAPTLRPPQGKGAAQVGQDAARGVIRKPRVIRVVDSAHFSDDDLITLLPFLRLVLGRGEIVGETRG